MAETISGNVYSRYHPRLRYYTAGAFSISQRGGFQIARYNDIRALAESHAAEISRSVQAWTGYLDTAATLYRYDFPETLLIHAQRPDATACAEMEIWNNRMGRWVNRGSKGIALIDDSGPRKS
ncbi:hypothetical protein SAMN04487833_1316 [Sarcina sp. DSM 11001]|uniref:hypothetical protein n=1 Tax=Sarcina sp. DSM 11001 TaxID=1798184 RepID=UPI000886E7CC|nr:hypothetical protein [Sarcina sp. DSM 11001]SDL76704.1 hypothetical protein SAMN04487833_1316 [Sarcina sp. DSM 11001]